MNRLRPWLLGVALLGLAAPVEAQQKKELKYRGQPVEYWVKRLSSDKKMDREAALKAVQAFGLPGRAKALTTLREMLSDLDAEYREFAAASLADLASPDSLPELTVMLNDPNWQVRVRVAQALGSLGEVARDTVPTLVGFLDQPQRELRREAAGALWKIARHQKSVPALVQCLEIKLKDSGNRALDQKTIHLLAVIGPDAKGALPALTKLLAVADNELVFLIHDDQPYASGSLDPRDARTAILGALRKIDPKK